jgi:hypothetical protein
VIGRTLTPDDGDDEGGPVEAPTVTIENTLPSLAGVSTSPASVTKSTGISATVTGWDDADGDGQNVRYEWYADGTSVGTSSSLSSSAYSRGEELYVVVTPYDGYGDGTALTSASTTVENSVP